MLDHMDVRLSRLDFDDEDHSDEDRIVLRNTVTGDVVDLQLQDIMDMVFNGENERYFDSEEGPVVITNDDAVEMIEAHQENWEE